MTFFHPFVMHCIFLVVESGQSHLFVLVTIVLYWTWSVRLFTCLMRIYKTWKLATCQQETLQDHFVSLTFKSSIPRKAGVWILYIPFLRNSTMFWHHCIDLYVGIVHSWPPLPARAPDFSSFAHHYQHLLLPHWNSAWYSDTGRFLAQSVRLVPPLPYLCQAFILYHETGTRQTSRYFPACVSSENRLLRRIVLAAKCTVCSGIC